MEGRKSPLLILQYQGGKGGRMNTARYCEQVLDKVLKDFYGEVKQERDHVQFQQDNALCYTSKHTKKWFNDHGIPLFYHPPNSPDLSLIEPVWHGLKKIICCCPHPPTSIEGLKAAVYTAWEELDIADVDKHILHMPNRVTAIFQARGGHTHFNFKHRYFTTYTFKI